MFGDYRENILSGELRMVKQVKVWMLKLNHMESPKYEELSVAALSVDKERLLRKYKDLTLRANMRETV